MLPTPRLQGEGEVKILDRLLHPWASVDAEDKHVILAGDSDLVLMGLMASQPRLHILSSVRCPQCAAVHSTLCACSVVCRE